ANAPVANPSGQPVVAAAPTQIAATGDTGQATGQLPAANYVLPKQYGEPGTGSGQMKQPSGIAVDGDGNMYVADTGNARVEKFDSTGKLVASWGGLGDGDTQFQEPVATLIDRDGILVVLDSKTGWLKKFSLDGK